MFEDGAFGLSILLIDEQSMRLRPVFVVTGDDMDLALLDTHMPAFFLHDCIR